MAGADRSRFAIADGMALIAAVAAGLGLIRFVGEQDVATRAAIAPGAGWNCLLALPLSWAVAALGLARRDARGRRARRSPGVLACAAVAIASAMAVAATSHNLIAKNFGGLTSAQTWQVIVLWTASPGLSAIAVMTTWMILAVNRRWRPRPDWLDRAGIALGLVWIASAVSVPVIRSLWP